MQKTIQFIDIFRKIFQISNNIDSKLLKTGVDLDEYPHGRQAYMEAGPLLQTDNTAARIY